MYDIEIKKEVEKVDRRIKYINISFRTFILSALIINIFSMSNIQNKDKEFVFNYFINHTIFSNS